MILKYQVALDKYDIKDLTDPILDGKFVSKAQSFEAARAKGTLSPEEIEATDTELCELFDKLHEFEEVNAPEVDQLKTQNLIHSVKEQAQASTDLQELTDMANKYKDYPELAAYIDKRAADVTVAIEKQAQEDADAKAKADREIAETEEKEKEAAVQAAKNNSLQARLLTKEDWTYAELRDLGITVTQDDMVVDEVYLQRQYLFKLYKVLGVVKKETA
jgi:hypothetical protein